MNKQALIKLATLRLAINHVLRQRYITKQAGLFKKKYEKPDWYNDEDAVNQLAEDLRFNRIWGRHPLNRRIMQAEKVYGADIDKANEAINKFNAHYRINRHSDRSAALLDRYYKLWGDNIRESIKPLMYKGDRMDSLIELRNDLADNYAYLPEDKRLEADTLLKDMDAYIDEWWEGMEDVPYSEFHDVDADLYTTYNEKMLKEPLTRTDVGSLADATPKQLEKWKSQSKKSRLWTTLWPSLLGAGVGAGLGSLVPKDSMGASAVLPGAVIGGVLGLLPGAINGDRLAKDKEHAKKRLSEV